MLFRFHLMTTSVSLPVTYESIRQAINELWLHADPDRLWISETDFIEHMDAIYRRPGDHGIPRDPRQPFVGRLTLRQAQILYQLIMIRAYDHHDVFGLYHSA